MNQDITSQAPLQNPSPNEQSAAPQIPKDLSDQWSAVEACATAWTCLRDASHKQVQFKAVEMSMGFLMKLHEQTVEACLRHPDAALIPQLKTLVQAQAKRTTKAAKKGKANGKSN